MVCEGNCKGWIGGEGKLMIILPHTEPGLGIGSLIKCVRDRACVGDLASAAKARDWFGSGVINT